MEIHVTSAVAVQAQELSDGVTVNAKFPPAAATVFDCGLRTKLHVPAVCVMVESANPPDQDTRIVPLRTAAVGLAAAVNVIVPGLVPAVEEFNPASLAFDAVVTALDQAAIQFMEGTTPAKVAYAGTAPAPVMVNAWSGTPWLPLLLHQAQARLILPPAGFRLAASPFLAAQRSAFCQAIFDYQTALARLRQATGQ